jgi:hypothetical protein
VFFESDLLQCFEVARCLAKQFNSMFIEKRDILTTSVVLALNIEDVSPRGLGQRLVASLALPIAHVLNNSLLALGARWI